MSEEVKPATVTIRHEAAPREPGDIDGVDFRRMTKDQFKQRVSEADEAGARRVLKAFGVKKDERDAMLARVRGGEFVLAAKPKEGDLDYKAEYEKVRPAIAELDGLRGKVKEYDALRKEIADAEFAKLPEAAQKYIVARGIEDPGARLAEIKALRASGIISDAPEPAKSVGKPATTGAPGGPRPTPIAGQKTAYDQWQELKKVDAYFAAQFAAVNRQAIAASTPSK